MKRSRHSERASSAVALFRDGRVALANAPWNALASPRAHAGGWVIVDGPRRRPYPDLGTLAAAELDKLRAGASSATLRCQSRSGEKTLRLQLSRVAAAGEGAIGLVLVEDVTGQPAHAAERSEPRDPAKRREQLTAIGRVAAGVAHDLGNALNALALRVYSVSRHADREARRHLRGMNDAIEMMRQTLDRLDRFSGRRSRPLKALDLAPVIRAAVDIAGLKVARTRRRRGAAAAIAVALELPRGLPRVVGDTAELTNVFVNLLLNARDAMPDGGTVTIRATAGTARVTVVVRDEGPGFAPEHLDRVFEPFFTTKGARGSGLGLSLAYGFMQAIGGAITVGNVAGGGAEIVLELPIARAADAARRRRDRVTA